MTRFGARAVMLNSWPTKHRLERMAEIMDPQGRGSMDERIHKGIHRLIALSYQHMISTQVVRCSEPGRIVQMRPYPLIPRLNLDLKTQTPTTDTTGPYGKAGGGGGLRPAGARVELHRPQLLAQRAFPLGRGHEHPDTEGPRGHPRGCVAVIVWECCD